MASMHSPQNGSPDSPKSRLKILAGSKLRSVLAGFGLLTAGAVAYHTSDTVRNAVDGGVKSISENVTQSHIISFSNTPIDEARAMIKSKYTPEEVQDILESFDNRIAALEMEHKASVVAISGDYYRSWNHGNSFFPYGFDRNHSVIMSDGKVVSADVDQTISENMK